MKDTQDLSSVDSDPLIKKPHTIFFTPKNQKFFLML
jgi:hypothetical protein